MPFTITILLIRILLIRDSGHLETHDTPDELIIEIKSKVELEGGGLVFCWICCWLGPCGGLGLLAGLALGWTLASVRIRDSASGHVAFF